MQRGWLQSGPLLWLCDVGKQVKVKAGKDEELRGWLLTVDPVSSSLVLVTFKEEGATVRVVMGHAVEEVTILQEADQKTAAQLRIFFPPPTSPHLDQEELRRRRGAVRWWLEKNRVPVVEEGDELRVAGVLILTAPYGPEDCRSSNQIILDRIQRLIRIQPDTPETDPDPAGYSRDRSGSGYLDLSFQLK
ncbi:gem-associated protein 6 isoform X1 [Melanotaenia boesemani]|uniref:gem-associated protein 6 isoform X1 n=2 Tax=Melanotaenia boesemani TaxID=1250792 RepID=UPI001C0541E5|nr:gem-associated protein 6 isoform X1 [Melanotaenia boesemani]